MAASTINLTVRSINSQVITTTTMGFVVSRMTQIMANQNTSTTASVTEAGDGSNQLASWHIYGTGDQLHWELTAAGLGHQVALYRGTGTSKILVAIGSIAGNGLVVLYEKNQSGIWGDVTLTYSAEDSGSTNLVQETTFTAEKDLELPGTSQFMYDMGNDYIVKYTVDETVSSINAAIDGDSQWITATESLTTAQITTLGTAPVEIITAPGAGYVIEIQGGFINLDYGGAAITGNVDVDLISETTATPLFRATNGISGGADKITRFIAVAGVADANEGITICAGLTGTPGDPTMGASTSSATVSVTYRITAL